MPAPLPPGPRLTALLAAAADPAWEPGFPEYVPALLALNDIVIRQNAGQAEGSLFYPWGVSPPDRPSPAGQARRRNFAMLAMAAASLLEVGVNAGHSCLLALTVNPDLHYTGIDWCGHPYSDACLDWLAKTFGDRLTLLRGDSREVLPRLAAERPGAFDLLHIDGGHDVPYVIADLLNAWSLVRPDGLVLVDDTNVPSVGNVVTHLVLRGLFRVEPLPPTWIASEQTLLRRVRST